MNKIDALISDADGTLVDTVKLIRHGQYETAKQYLTKHGIPQDELPDYSTYEAHLNEVVGGSARDTLERTVRLLYSESPHHLDTMDFDELHSMLNPVQDAMASEFVHAYEGLSSTLHALGKSDIALAIFTSGRPHHLVRNFGIALPELEISSLYKDPTLSDNEKVKVFEKTIADTYDLPGFTVVTAHDTQFHKPNPESLLLAMSRLGASPQRSAVLGDHKVDMEAAVNANVTKRIGITHGFDDKETLIQNGATETVDSLSELVNVLMD